MKNNLGKADGQRDVYSIPCGDKWIVYRPRRHLAFVGNQALVEYLEERHHSSVPRNTKLESFLARIGFDRPGIPCESLVLQENPVAPVHAVLLMTNRCNLRCSYCYADAGAVAGKKEIDWLTAKTAIDYVIQNARESGQTPAITFHGGGEPTIHWKRMVQMVEYARDQHPGIQVSMSSNGVWSQSQREFICRHFSSISLSMDGTESVQNRQRPKVGGHASADSVWSSLFALEQSGIDYGIRMTVLPESVAEIEEGVRSIIHLSRCMTIQIEPTFTRTRGTYGDIDPEFANLFIKHFLNAWRYGREQGVHVYYSGARPWVISTSFCQAPLKAVIANADGQLVTCFEVFSEASPYSRSFSVGRIVDGRIEHDRSALKLFLDHQQNRRSECQDCFCYWHCCGDCATRRPGPRTETNGRCSVTRGITQGMIESYLEENDGLWIGMKELSSGKVSSGKRFSCVPGE